MKLVVIDYGLCNIKSVCNALDFLGIQALVSDDPFQLRDADKAILPGVGAFADGMKGLQAKGMVEAIHEFVDKGRPLLGICLGMQMLMDQSHEFGLHKGLSLIPGEVKPLANALKDSSLKVPHIGWSGLKPFQSAWDNSILARIPVNSPMYFVHSFYADPVDPAHRLAVTSYGAVEFASVIAKDNVCGCQFHPEKSAGLGLRIMEQFIHWR